MKKEAYQDEMKAILLLQKRSKSIADAHSQIDNDIAGLKEQIAALGGFDSVNEHEFQQKKSEYIHEMSAARVLTDTPIEAIYDQAGKCHPGRVRVNEILAPADKNAIDDKISNYIIDFNRRYGLDGWDYAIAGSAGLFAAMLDLLCVKAPPKPTVSWDSKIDGVFNEAVRKAFNKFITPELSAELSKKFPIGAPDVSILTDLIDAPEKALNPLNHRLRSLAHDPILGLFFGVLDMIQGTCTIVINGEIKSIPTKKPSVDGNIFQLLGRMFGHLLSDVNAPSAKGNRGMGLPAPFMSLLKMFEGIKINDMDLGKQVEYLYVNGYDFRQFIVSSMPMAIMEILLRVFYIIKQMSINKASFADSLMDTLPGRMNPRFRIMLALAYGVSSSVNAGKMYVTQDVMNVNYASWMGLCWNGFHALKWALFDKHLKLWSEIEESEILEIESVVLKLDELQSRAMKLPV